ncbi:hypothetical protein [Prauserella endophytica]|uniref:hypothetical protein n=1 Tax=Prauserella TaxID=142577 RepID=UPI002B4000EC|nr:hypothetical protein [Prauserella endophytica]
MDDGELPPEDDSVLGLWEEDSGSLVVGAGRFGGECGERGGFDDSLADEESGVGDRVVCPLAGAGCRVSGEVVVLEGCVGAAEVDSVTGADEAGLGPERRMEPLRGSSADLPGRATGDSPPGGRNHNR